MPTETKLPGKVERGGTGFNYHKDTYRTHLRCWDFPTNSGNLQGFRCAYPIDKGHITERRVLLGGSWGSLDSYYFNAHCRNRLYPDLKSVWQGFRCVYPVTNNSSGAYRVLQGGAWYDDEAYGFRTYYHSRNTSDYWNALQGFRCIYPAHQTFSKKHTLKGGPWDTNCSPTALSYYSITFEPQRLKDIGFRCIYPSGGT